MLGITLAAGLPLYVWIFLKTSSARVRLFSWEAERATIITARMIRFVHRIVGPFTLDWTRRELLGLLVKSQSLNGRNARRAMSRKPACERGDNGEQRRHSDDGKRVCRVHSESSLVSKRVNAIVG